jgi:hypothetical protein
LPHRIEARSPSCRSEPPNHHAPKLTPELPPIGTTVIYRGRAYRFCGVTPASIQPITAVLRDLRTGAWTQVPVAQLTARPERR